MSIQGVIFDAYGTLFDVHSIGKRAEQLFPGMGPSISTLWRDKQIEYSRLVSLADPGPSGSRYYRTFWELTRAALEYALQRMGVRHFKTHPMCYDLASTRLNVSVKSLMFVSSNGWDVMAATWFGFQTCWVNRQGLPLETIGEAPHHVLANLEGVEHVL